MREKTGFYTDLTGQVYGYLTVTSFAGRGTKGKSLWNVKCKCGKEKAVLGDSLKQGQTKSCGCGHKDFMKSALGKHVGKLTGAKWCRIVFNAEARNHVVTITQQEASDLFEQQEGRCSLSGVNLVLDGPLQQQTASLDRIDSNKGYEVGNVQWIHKDLNKMKNTFSMQEIKHWMTLVVKHQGW